MKISITYWLAATALFICMSASVKAQNDYYEHFWDDKQKVYQSGELEVREHGAEDMWVAMLTTCTDFPLPSTWEDTVVYGVMVCCDIYNSQKWTGWNLGYHFQFYNNATDDVSLSSGDDEEDYKFCHLNYLYGFPNSCSCDYEDDEEHNHGSDCGCRTEYDFCSCVLPYFEMTGFAGPYFPYSTVQIIIYRYLRPGEEHIIPW